MKKVARGQHEEMVRRYRQGETLSKLGAELGITGERVRQILSKYGVNGCLGGKRVAVMKANEDRQIKRDAVFMSKYGCTENQFKSIRGNHKSGAKAPLYAFLRQRRHACARAVEWRLTFWDWWAIWRDSGKWDVRGRGVGRYVMCRKEDLGAYEVGNVYIGTGYQNSVEGRTLSYERGGKKTYTYRVIQAAGGRRAVAEALGYSPKYISVIGCHQTFPPEWRGRGHVETIAEMTCGAFSANELTAHIRRVGEAS